MKNWSNGPYSVQRSNNTDNNSRRQFIKYNKNHKNNGNINNSFLPPVVRESKHKNNYIKHHQWNLSIILAQSHRKRIFQRVKSTIYQMQASRQHYDNNNNQPQLYNTADPLSVTGVIYVIVHLPSSRLYVGQTINSAHHRLKQHWQDRFKSDFRNGTLHQLMQNHSFNSFITWPVELIRTSMYPALDRKEQINQFRRHANYRELAWIRKLRTLAPRGLNSILPIRTPFNRRTPRPGRWNDRQRTHHNTNHECATIMEDGRLEICTHSGTYSRVRHTVTQWLTTHTTEPQLLAGQVADTTPAYRAIIKRWMMEHVPPQSHISAVSAILDQLTELQNPRADFPRRDASTFDAHIKIVHSHPAIKSINLAHLIHQADIMALFPTNMEVPQICYKQNASARQLLCNFTSCALSLPVDRPPEDALCPCRAMLPHCKDFLRGHVMSTDHTCVSNAWFVTDTVCIWTALSI
jgi:hypothetical protein